MSDLAERDMAIKCDLSGISLRSFVFLGVDDYGGVNEILIYVLASLVTS